MPRGYNLTEKEGQRITELIGQDLSYCEIGRRIGINRNSISIWCRKNGYARNLPDYLYNTIEANKKRSAAIRKGNDKKNTFVCKYCGVTYIRRRKIENEGKQYCCPEHAFADWKERKDERERRRDERGGFNIGASRKVYFPICKVCLVPFTTHTNRKCCCKECRMEFNRRAMKVPKYLKQRRIQYRNDNNLSLISRNCIVCNEKFETWLPSKTTCSDACSKLMGNWRKIEQRIYTLKRNQKPNEYFNNIEIYTRDGWKCKLCGKKVNKNKMVPHPKAPTIDHIIPLSCGGAHIRKNVQLAHFRCNCKKGNRTTKNGEQLLLLG